MKVIEGKSLSFRYSQKEAYLLEGVSFTVHEGEILTILGDNATGKSTLLSMISTLLRGGEGEVLYYGKPLADWDLKELRGKIGYVPQEVSLYPSRSLLENFLFFAGLYGMKGKERKGRVMDVIQSLDLEEEKDKPVRKLSGGMKRRGNLGAGLLHEPEILILDEPTVGIDFSSRGKILQTLKELQKTGMTVVQATHSLEEVRYLGGEVSILENRRLKSLGNIDKDQVAWFNEYETMGGLVSAWLKKEEE